MKLGNSLKKNYELDLIDAIKRYAFVNNNFSPIMHNVPVDGWHGQIFEVANIKKHLHYDLIEDLQDLNLFSKIMKECTHFVIMPDIWSKSLIPITGPTYPRNQYDTDRWNVVIVNGRIFELQNLTMKAIVYNHNKKFYCFYNDALSGNMFKTTAVTDYVQYNGDNFSEVEAFFVKYDLFNQGYDIHYNQNKNAIVIMYENDPIAYAELGYYIYLDPIRGTPTASATLPTGTTDPTLEFIGFGDNVIVVDNVNDNGVNVPNWDELDGMFKFEINKDNRIATGDIGVDRVGIAVNHPYIELDYSEAETPAVGINIPGLISHGTDVFIRPKWFNMDDEKFYIHNEDILFSNTFLVIYQDKTYSIQSTYMVKEQSVIEKIDKHTIRVARDPNISKIIIFCFPFDTRYKKFPPDSLYYKSVKINEQAPLFLKYFNKYTNDLYDWLSNDPKINMDKIIDYGYKYDLDVLRVIQNFFATVIRLDPKSSVWYLNKIDGKPLAHLKIVLHVQNKLQYYPTVFINGRMYNADYRIVKHSDVDLIILDPAILFEQFGNTNGRRNIKDAISIKPFAFDDLDDYKLEPYVPPIDIEYNINDDIDYVRERFERIVDDLKVIFTPYKTLSYDDDLSRQGGRIYRTPIYKGELILDDAGYDDNEHLFTGYQFVNGYLSNTGFEPTLFRWLDGVNLFDTGPVDFSVIPDTDPSDTDVYNVIIPTIIEKATLSESVISVGGQTKLTIDFVVDNSSTSDMYISNVTIKPSTIIENSSGILKVDFTDPADLLTKTDIYNGKLMSLLINRTTTKLTGISKVWFSNTMSSHIINYVTPDIPKTIGKIPYKEFHTLCFDKYGVLCSDKVDFLSTEYIGFNQMYNYLPKGHQVYNDIVVNMCCNKLVDDVLEFDLEFDTTRISPLNTGTYNERAMNNSRSVRAMWNPLEPTAMLEPPIIKKENYRLLGEKILTRYWLGPMGNIYNKTQFAIETQNLGGKYVNTDGTIGTIDPIFSDFIVPEIHYIDTPLIRYMIGPDVVYDLLLGAGVNYISHTDKVIDTSVTYSANVTDLYDFYSGSRLILHFDNEAFVKY